MALYHVQDVIRALPGGAGESGATVTFKKVSDNSIITTATTDSNGFFQKSLADSATTGQSSYTLHPGPFSYEVTIGSYVRRKSSVATGKAGPVDLAGLVQLSRAFGNGLISSPANGLNTGAVAGTGSALTVTVATLAAVLDGITVWNDAIRTLTIAANASGLTRIDTVVLEMTKAGQAEEGKCLLKVVQGTAGAGASTLTDSTSTIQFPLADVTVANGASVINIGDVTDRRDYVERSVTAVEADVADLEDRVTDLELPVVPRVDLVGYYQGVWNPPSIAANSYTEKDFELTMVNGYAELVYSDLILVTHGGVAITIRSRIEAYKKGIWLSGTPNEITATVIVYNDRASSLNIVSETLTILVYRLVLA